MYSGTTDEIDYNEKDEMVSRKEENKLRSMLE